MASTDYLIAAGRHVRLPPEYKSQQLPSPATVNPQAWPNQPWLMLVNGPGGGLTGSLTG